MLPVAMLRALLASLTLVTLGTCVGAIAHAEDAGELAYLPEEPEARAPREGPYVHVRLGASGLGLFGRGPDVRERAGGSALDFGFAIGRSIVPGTAVFLAIDASFLPAGMQTSSLRSIDHHAITAGALGVGFVRYVPDRPLRVGATFLVEFLSFAGYEGDDPANVGPFARLEIGRDWRVSEALELGLTGYVLGGWATALPSNDVAAPMSPLGAIAVGLAGTLTFR